MMYLDSANALMGSQAENISHNMIKNVSPKNPLAVQEGISEPLKEFREEQTRAGIQDSALTTSFRMTLLISQFLINDQGEFDKERALEVMDYLENNAFEGTGSKPYFMIRIQEVLSLLIKPDSPLIPILESITAPKNPDSLERCKLMINSTLVRSPENELTDRDAKIVALKHILDNARELGTNTSLVEGIQIGINTVIPQLALTDVSSLLIQGVCFRKCLNETIANTFPTYITSTTLNKEISINSLGDIQNANVPADQTIKIYEAPPIKVALLQMGIPSNDSALNKTVINNLSKGQTLFKSTTEGILYAYAEEWVKIHSEEKKSALMERGCYASATLSNSPSQRAIVSIILAMPQNGTEAYPASWIVECITKTFREKIQKESNVLKESQGWVSKFIFWRNDPNKGVKRDGNAVDVVNGIFTGVLNKKTSVQFEQIQDDHKGAFGTYRLYETNVELALKNPSNIGLRISGAEESRKFVYSAICETGEIIQKSDFPPSTKKEYQFILNEMASYCLGKTFIDDCLNVYNNQLGLNVCAFPPLVKGQKTFWNSGYFPPAAFLADTWFGSAPAAQEIKELSYDSIDQLIDWVFNEVVGINSLAFGQDKPRMYPGFANSGLFELAFNWLTEDPSIIRLKQLMDKDQLSLSDALNSTMAVPGLEVANTPINIVSFVDFFIKSISQITYSEETIFFNPVSESQEEDARFREVLVAGIEEKITGFIKTFKDEKLTIHSVSNALVNFLNQAFNPQNKIPITNIIEGLVTIVTIRSLSKDNYGKIVNNAVHVADSNFTKTVDLYPRNLQITFFFNPVTNSYGLATITEGDNPFFYPLTRCLENVRATLRDLRQLNIIFP